ncbi:MAG TPA: DinB family protein [Gemmatimonadaceae bacterium]|nr:DinB family protein [Gemmatimonadaceae bacterium]
MSIAESLLPEFDHEMASTRTALERANPDRLGWQPHEKSMSLGELTTHITDLVRFIPSIIHEDEVNLYPPGGEPFETQEPFAYAEMLSRFEANVAEARTALAGATDTQLMQAWTLKAGDHDLGTLPKVAAYRSVAMNHLIHHRGQLIVYLRLTGTAVPGLYGPSADDRELAAASAHAS